MSLSKTLNLNCVVLVEQDIKPQTFDKVPNEALPLIICVTK